MFQRTRYQQGMVYRVKRKQGPDCWIFRWREEDATGKRIRRKVTLGTVKQYPTEASALKAAESLRITINQEQSKSGQQPVSVDALINHFKENELSLDEGIDDEEGRALFDPLQLSRDPRFSCPKEVGGSTNYAMCEPLQWRSGCAS